MREAFDKHHIYLKGNDNRFILLTSAKHTQLHQKVYEYLLEKYGKYGIDDYLKWFDEKYGLY